jgi:hypothetical protein
MMSSLNKFIGCNYPDGIALSRTTKHMPPLYFISVVIAESFDRESRRLDLHGIRPRMSLSEIRALGGDGYWVPVKELFDYNISRSPVSGKEGN